MFKYLLCHLKQDFLKANQLKNNDSWFDPACKKCYISYETLFKLDFLKIFDVK